MEEDSSKNKGKEIERAHPREDIIVNVIYEVLSPIKDVGLTRNISQGGLCLLIDNELPPGTLLGLKFRLPHEEARLIESTVEVVWQKKTDKGYLTGVKYKK